MGRTFPSLATLLLLARCLAPAPASAADAPPADGPRPIAKLAGPAGTTVAFSRDGKLILTAGGDSARVWHARTYEPVADSLKHKDGGNLFLALLSPDGGLVLTVVNDEAWVWEANAGRRLSVLRHAHPIRSAAFSPDGQRVVTAGDNGFARLWEARTGKGLSSLEHPAAVVHAEFSEDGKRMLTVVGDPGEPDAGLFRAFARLWDVETGRLVSRFGVDDPGNAETPRQIRPATVSADGRRVATICFKVVYCTDAEGDGSNKMPTWDRIGMPLALQFSPDGANLVTAGTGGVIVWNAHRDGKVVQRLTSSWTGDAVFNRSGDRLLIRNDTDESGVWDVRTGSQLLALRPSHPQRFPATFNRSGKPIKEIPAAAFSPDGRRVAAGFASDGYTAVWEVPEGKGP
jgi:WD40 repeat protein